MDLSCWYAPGNCDCLPTFTTTTGRRLMLVLPDRRRAALLGIAAAEYAQGFPPDWTVAAGDDGRGGSTLSASKEGGGGLAARFAMVGSAVSVPVAQWLGERLADPLSHKYVHGASDRALQSGDSLAAWPAAAWGRGIGQRFEATALLASGFAKTPVLLPLRPLGTAVGTLMREGLCAADVLRYARKMRDSSWSLHPAVCGTRAAAFGLKERDMAKPCAERRTLVGATCPTPYSPRYWPAARTVRDARIRWSCRGPVSRGVWCGARRPNEAPASASALEHRAALLRQRHAMTSRRDGRSPCVEEDEPAELSPARSLRPLQLRATREAGCPLPPPPLLPLLPKPASPPPLVAVVHPRTRARSRALLVGP
eukprot:SM000048S16555  [mRNA]  locus=s48:439639:441439:+ [translate_table: standard]